MIDAIRPYLARICAAIAAGIVLIVAKRWGLNLNGTIESGVADALMLITYGIFHKGLDSKINPVDAARIKTAKDHSDQSGG